MYFLASLQYVECMRFAHVSQLLCDRVVAAIATEPTSYTRTCALLRTHCVPSSCASIYASRTDMYAWYFTTSHIWSNIRKSHQFCWLALARARAQNSQRALACPHALHALKGFRIIAVMRARARSRKIIINAPHNDIAMRSMYACVCACVLVTPLPLTTSSRCCFFLCCACVRACLSVHFVHSLRTPNARRLYAYRCSLLMWLLCGIYVNLCVCSLDVGRMRRVLWRCTCVPITQYYRQFHTSSSTLSSSLCDDGRFVFCCLFAGAILSGI